MKFDSAQEKDRFDYLCHTLRSAPERQIATKVVFHGFVVTVYKWDFVYFKNGKIIFEEFKGFFHRESRMRFKLASAEVISADEEATVLLVTRDRRGAYIEKEILLPAKGKQTFRQKIGEKIKCLTWNDLR